MNIDQAIENVAKVGQHRIQQIMGKKMIGIEHHSLNELMVAAYVWGMQDGLQTVIDNPNCIKGE